MIKKHKKNLILLIPSLAGGGAERVASVLIPELSKTFDVTLVVLDDCISYQLPPHIKLIAFSRPASSTVLHILRIPYQIIRVVRLIQKTRTSTVLSFMEQANIINLLAASVTGHVTILSQHTDPYSQYAYKGLLGSLILTTSRNLYKKAERIICVSKWIKDTLESQYNISPNHLCFIPNPLNTSPIDRYSLEGLNFSEPFILQVGRLHIRTKGQDLTIKAFSKLVRTYPRLNLVFTGEGPDKANIKSLARELGCQKNVFFTGWIKDPRALMKKALFLVHPSRYEGWPNVLAEALWCGCPVIASNCSGGGPEEMLEDGKFGMLIAPDNEKELEKAMRLFLEDGELRKGFMEAGRIRARDFEPSKIALRYKKVIEEAALGAD